MQANMINDHSTRKSAVFSEAEPLFKKHDDISIPSSYFLESTADTWTKLNRKKKRQEN